MIPRFHAPSRTLPLLLSALISTTAAAQTPVVISGRVIDQGGTPVAGIEVLLHRVAGQDGARIADAVSDENGAFTFTVEGEQPAGGVYFATARFQEQVYIGSFLEAPIEPGLAYDVVVGGEPVSFGEQTMPPAAGSAAGARPPANPRRWALAIVPLIALIGVGAATLAKRGRQARRTLLIRLAVLEEELAANGETEGLLRERARILEQLGGGPGS